MKIFKNILAVIAGIIGGGIINMGIIELGPSIIPNPEGFDNSTMETLADTPTAWLGWKLAEGKK